MTVTPLPITRDHYQTLAGVILTLTAMLFPLVGIFAPLGQAPLGIIAVLACLPLVIRHRLWRRFPQGLMLWLGLLGGWSLLSMAWAIDPRETLGGASKQLFTAVAGVVLICAAWGLEAPWRGRVVVAFCTSVFLATTIIVVEYLTDRGVSALISHYKGQALLGVKSPLNRGATILALSAWSWAALALAAPRGWWRWGAVVVFAGVMIGDSSSTRLAIILGLTAATLVALMPRRGLHLLMVAVTATWFALPLAATQLPEPQYTFRHWTWLPLSSHHRVTIWGFTAQRIVEKPLLGWGMDSARSMPGGEDEVVVTRPDPNDPNRTIMLYEALLPLHPHNAVLQIWLELGLPGALLTLAFLLHVLKRIDTLDANDRRGRAVAAGLFCSMLVICAVSYGVWQSWWQFSMWFVTTFAIMGLTQGRRRS